MIHLGELVNNHILYTILCSFCSLYVVVYVCIGWFLMDREESNCFLTIYDGFYAGGRCGSRRIFCTCELTSYVKYNLFVIIIHSLAHLDIVSHFWLLFRINRAEYTLDRKFIAPLISS